MMPPLDPDKDLWERAQNRDEQAFNQLWLRCIPLVRGQLRQKIYHLNREDLQDLEQVVRTTVWVALPKFRGDCRFSTWVVGIAKNISLDWLRRQRTQQRLKEEVEYDLGQDFAPAPEEQAVRNVSLQEALKKLSDSEREIVHLLCILQLTDIHVAELTKIPLGTVKSRKRAALGKLRTAMLADEVSA